jgi:hypothetical protein
MDPANKLATSATTFSGMISSLLLAKLANHREILRSSCHKKATALLPISRAKNLICSTQSICATSSLACPVSLCFAHDCRSSVATRCCHPRSCFFMCLPCSANNSIDLKKISCLEACSIVYEICRYTWVTAQHRGRRDGCGNRRTTSLYFVSQLARSLQQIDRVAENPLRVPNAACL